jgi:hypothetical protein
VWSAEDLENAVKAVNGGTSMNKISKEHDIPLRKLRNHLSLKWSTERKMCEKSFLSDDQERHLAKRIIRLVEVGFLSQAKQFVDACYPSVRKTIQTILSLRVVD